MRIEPRSDPMTTASPAHGRQYPDEGSRETKPPLGSASSVHPTGSAMKEQSDTPRTDAAFEAVDQDCKSQFEWDGWKFARQLERALATATRERDEARADLDRFRHTAKRYRYLASWCSVMSADIDGNHYWVSRISSARLRGASFEEAVDKAMERDHWERSALAATEAARKFCGVGELERAGYIPAGSADEREAKP